jgi:hypothetical protein
MDTISTPEAGERTQPKVKYPYRVTMMYSRNGLDGCGLWGNWSKPTEVSHEFLTAKCRADYVKGLRSHCDYRISDVRFSMVEENFYCHEHKYNPPAASGFALCPQCEVQA